MHTEPQLLAPVVELGARRRSRRTKHARARAVHGLVALWFGTAIFTALVLVGQLTSLALKHGLAGLGIGVVITAAIAWPAAAYWLRRVRSASQRSSGPIRRPSMRLATKPSRRDADSN